MFSLHHAVFPEAGVTSALHVGRNFLRAFPAGIEFPEACCENLRDTGYSLEISAPVLLAFHSGTVSRYELAITDFK